ncbi:hypothetical protein LCGC14_1721200 [marine sediment metagenome]|uniref:Uncharacterized protein n=1 Tax=marine sediment metagenome TaxID=412755 RepID=A0A0F9KC30_9ZZZZ
MNAKDRSMVARMAGNIAGGILSGTIADAKTAAGPGGTDPIEVLDVLEGMAATMSVNVAIAILKYVDAAIDGGAPCAGCSEPPANHPNDSGCREWHAKL